MALKSPSFGGGLRLTRLEPSLDTTCQAASSSGNCINAQARFARVDGNEMPPCFLRN